METRRISKVLFMLSVMVLLLAGCGKQKVDLSEYVMVTYTGLNGNATATVDLDSDSMKDFLLDEKADDGENLKRLLKIASTINCELDKTEGLSNGDKVVVSITWDEEVAKEYGLAFSGKTKEFEVSGLEEGKVIDVFQDISLEYSETSPNANLTICNNSKDSFASGIRYSASKSIEIANGDEITITASFSESDAEEQGYIIEETEKVFTVSGVDEYIKEYAQIDDVTLEKIKAQTKDLMDAGFADESAYRRWVYPDGSSIGHLVGTFEVLETKLNNAYFLSLKEGMGNVWGTENNILYLVYEVNAKDDISPDGKTAYLVAEIKDFILRGNGEIDVVVTDTKINSAYDNLDDLYRDIVTAHKDMYTCEEISY